MDYVRTVAPQCLIWHVPNGGERPAHINTKGKRVSPEAAKLKLMGLLPGIPDLGLAAEGPFMAFIEVKRPGEYLTAEQRDMRRQLLAMGFAFEVVRSIEDMRACLRRWNIETREAVYRAQQPLPLPEPPRRRSAA